MIFDLSTLHLGDVLMALPAMREGDAVVTRHRVPGAPVEWIDPEAAPPARERTYPAMRRGRHTTDAWLESTGRAPVRHRLAPEADKRQIVIAPVVRAPEKQWPADRWEALRDAIPGALYVDGDVDRAEWMRCLNIADTVICPDTGTAHMADALGCPRVIALHGVPANWPHCAPYWDRRYCIARESMDAITVDDVLEVVRG